ncbi:MAG: CDP-alcohol phosphatidyltransferase family protein [Kiritimatiellae bacterium]|nr:CDP-alcohol phosphatidyltransferase family protein [Kiritimatiellia bacterium]
MSRRRIVVTALTFSRLPLIFAWFALAIAGELRESIVLGVLAVLSMFFAGVSDAFDGLLARRWNEVSALGKMADPLMDKVFYVVAFPTLVWMAMHQGDCCHSLVLLVFAVLCILRDLWVTFMRSVGSLYGADCAAMWLGKVRTALSFPFAGLVYIYLIANAFLPPAASSAARMACFAMEAAMIALNAVSFVSYTRAYAPYLKLALDRGREI